MTPRLLNLLALLSLLLFGTVAALWLTRDPMKSWRPVRAAVPIRGRLDLETGPRALRLTLASPSDPRSPAYGAGQRPPADITTVTSSGPSSGVLHLPGGQDLPFLTYRDARIEGVISATWEAAGLRWERGAAAADRALASRIGAVLIPYASLTIPYAYLLAATAAPPLLWVRIFTRSLDRRHQGRCPRCGFDLRATPGRCPECGTTAARATA